MRDKHRRIVAHEDPLAAGLMYAVRQMFGHDRVEYAAFRAA